MEGLPTWLDFFETGTNNFLAHVGLGLSKIVSHGAFFRSHFEKTIHFDPTVQDRRGARTILEGK